MLIMKTKKIESKAFLCEYFHIPRTAKTQWCIVEEIIGREQFLRLGLWITDTSLYLDIAQRRFFTQGRCGQVRRIVYPAKRIGSKQKWKFISTDMHKLTFEVPKSYIADIYYPAIYNAGLLHDRLY